MSSSAPAWGYAQSFRTRKPVSTAVMACLTAIMMLATLGAAQGIHQNGAIGIASIGLMAMICGWGTLQLARGRVLVSASGISIRGAFRSKHYHAAEVDHVEVAPSRNGRVAVLWLRSGKRVRIQALSARRGRATTRLSAQVDEINRSLQTRATGSADGSPPSLRISATRERDRRRAQRLLILGSVLYIVCMIALAVIIRTPLMFALMSAAIVLELGIVWRVVGRAQGSGPAVSLMLVGLALLGGVARVVVDLGARSAPQLTRPAGFDSGVAQTPTSGLWELSGTIASSTGYSDSSPGTQIRELIGIQRQCTSGCRYQVTRVFENPAGGNPTATVTLTHHADGWRATWPGEVSQCGGSAADPIMWTAHELWTIRFTNHGRSMQANGRSLSYNKRCGYGEDSVTWSAQWTRALTPKQFRQLSQATAPQQ